MPLPRHEPPRITSGRRPMQIAWAKALAEWPREHHAVRCSRRQVLPVRRIQLTLAPVGAHGGEPLWPLASSAIPAGSQWPAGPHTDPTAPPVG